METVFHIRLVRKEADAIVRETLDKVPFGEIRKIDFKMEHGRRHIHIHKRDGSSLSIIPDLPHELFREKDADGKTIREIRGDWMSHSAGTVQGEVLIFKGFKGRARTSSGEEGDYYIRLSEVRSIAFEEL